MAANFSRRWVALGTAQVNGEVPRRRGASSRTGSSRAGARSGGGDAQGPGHLGAELSDLDFPGCFTGVRCRLPRAQ
jgi:hypothetical protein